MELILPLLESIAHFLVSPMTTFFVLLLIAIAIKRLFADALSPSWLTILAISYLLVCSLPMTAHMMLRPLEVHKSSVKKDDNEWKAADAIVVLACRHYEDEGLPFADRWHNCSLTRNIQAVVMYNTQPTKIYTSGGVLKGLTRSEASVNREFLVTLGIPEHQVIAVEEGTNTAEEARALSALLKGKHIALVTSASHQRRASHYLSQQGIDVTSVPVDHFTRDDIPWGWPSIKALQTSQRAIYEWLALLKQKFE